MNNNGLNCHATIAKIMRILFLFGVLCSGLAGFNPTPLLAAETLLIGRDFPNQPMGKYLEYYVDATHLLTIEDIARTGVEFQDAGDGYPSFGYSRSVYWFRFSVMNPIHENVSWNLELCYAPMDFVELFIPEGSGYKTMSGGDQQEFRARPIKSRNVTFPISQPPGRTTCYLRIKSSGSLNIALHAWPPEAFEDKERSENSLFWIYYGIMLAMIVYGGMLGLFTRELSNLYLILFIAAVSLFSMVQNGFAFQYLWPTATHWNNICNPFFLILCSAWALRFTKSFLDTAVNAPRLNYIFIGLFWLGIILTSAPFLVDYYYATQISISYGLAAIITNFCCGLLLALKRQRQANFYLAAWFIFLFCSAMTVFRSFGIVQANFLTIWGMQIGTALMILLLSLGIADRINTVSAEKEKALVALGESEKKYRSLVENAHDGILLIVKEKVVYANRAILEMLEFPAEDFSNIHMLELLPDTAHGLEFVYNIYKRRIAGQNAPSRYEAQLLTKKGAIIDVLISSAMLTLDENQAVISIITNITNRKKAEDELRKAHSELENRVSERTSELRKANIELKIAKKTADDSARAKSEFLANMSHEIRTPMNGILGVCDLFTNTKMDRLQREYLDIIRSSSRSLLNLINDILDFSKIEAGRLDFEQVPFSIQELIEEVSDMFMDMIQKKDLELVVDISADVPAKVISDPLRLRQVLVNLTSNALKFTEKGEINLSIRNRVSDESYIELLFCVKDTGIGMDQTTIDNLFSPFTQADGSISRKYGGTGLGLAISKKIVKAMGGDIWAESNLGAGSSFYFTGKFTKLNEKSEITPGKPSKLQGLSVLIVDDNATVQLVLQRCLESFGCRTATASSAEEALALFQQRLAENPFDLILMDFKLPKMDGISASAIIKQEKRIKPPPIVMISGYLRDQDLQQAKAVGIDSCMIKPVKQSALMETILEIFGQPSAVEKNSDSGLIQPLEFKDIKLLLVEDHPTNRRVVKEILKAAGFLVDSVGSGLEAVEAVRKTIYHAVLMDIQMPEMDGLQATRTIREKLLIWDMPIIAMTAHVMPGDRERCLDSGMNDYVSKPIDRIQLFSTLRKYIFGESKQLSTAPDATELPAELAGIELKGLNINEALNRLGISLKAFSEILSDFAQIQKNFPVEFRTLIREEKRDQALNKAHSLKGAAATVSADSLSDQARRIEQAFPWPNPQELETQLQEIEIRLKQVTDSAEILKNSLLSAPNNADTKIPTNAPKNFSGETFRFLSARLKQSLEDLDPVSSKEYYNLIRAEIPEGHNHEQVQQLGKNLEQYDFELAVQCLQNLAAELNKELV